MFVVKFKDSVEIFNECQNCSKWQNLSIKLLRKKCLKKNIGKEVIGQSYNLQFETPGLPRLPRLWDSQDSGTPKTPKTPGRPMEKVKATSRKFHSSPNHFQVQIQA